uniref:Nucleoporin autopeptidase n=2 Tax=Rhizophora mucronata TaxID=61149 RepID=A0A2P2KJE9_RHIMU
MFGSTNPFGQSSSSPFGSQSVFGQTSNATNNPFAPKPFGSTTPFGSQTGTSLFGGTSTGAFGAAQNSSPFSSTTAFAASSSPAFGSSTPAFGASSTPAFGSSSSSFGGSMFGQKPVFGGFGSSTQTSPFGSTSQQSQPGFGSSLFGSTTPFGASSQSAFGASSTPGFGSTSTTAFGASSAPAFGASSTPAFGASSTPAFGAANTPAFGAANTPAFGSTSTPAFGATSGPAFGTTANSAFGSSGSAFGASSTPVFGSGGAFGASSTSLFGSSSTSAFGASSSPAFGASSASAFGPSSSPAFGASSTSAFGASSSPSFSFASSPSFGQSTSAFGSSSFGTSASPFGGQSSPFGAPATTPTFGSPGFGQSAFGAQRTGSRVAAYMATTETESTGGSGQTGKLESISAMPVYKEKSHEELRWEDYQSGDKGGPLPSGQSPVSFGFATPAVSSNPFTPQPSFVQSSATQFSTSLTNLNPFTAKPTGFAVSTTGFSASPFGTSSTSFPSTSFGPTTSSPFGGTTSSSIFSTSATAAFGSTPSLFSSTTGQATSLPFSSIFSNTQQSPSFPSTTPSLGQTGSIFGQGTTSSFNPAGIFSTPSTGIPGGIFSTTPSLVPSSTPTFGQTTLSQSSGFQLSQPSQSTGAFNLSNIAAAGTSGFPGASTVFGQSNLGQLSATQSSIALQPLPVTNPFGTLPVMPQMSIGRAGTSPSVQYGISSMPVVDKPAPVRISSLLTSRHLSQRRIRLPARKYYPKQDSPKVPFFNDEEETPSTPKADALFIPRENPRALVIRPSDQLSLRASIEKTSPLKDVSTSVHRNGKILEAADAPLLSVSNDQDENSAEDNLVKERMHNVKLHQKPNGVQEEHSTQKEESYVTISGHRAGEAAIVYEHGADIEALMPKLRRSDYYTEPRIRELAAKERAEPGFCRRVKDFFVGRHGYGNIKFVGETDVRRLDLESLVQFNNREVIVYMDDSKKPPVGQGLNKPAEVTLLNIKCFDKKTGHQYTEGPKIEKYKEMLKKKAEDQGAEFVSYDPVKGEWKFKVSHFSKYWLGDEEEMNWDTQTAGVC